VDAGTNVTVGMLAEVLQTTRVQMRRKQPVDVGGGYLLENLLSKSSFDPGAVLKQHRRVVRPRSLNRIWRTFRKHGIGSKERHRRQLQMNDLGLHVFSPVVFVVCCLFVCLFVCLFD
jgi:hypothetical protein